MRPTVRDGGAGLRKMTCSISRFAASSPYTTGVPAPIIFDTRNVDPLGMWDGVSTVTIPITGHWDMQACIVWAVSTATGRSTGILRNGAAIASGMHTANPNDADCCPAVASGILVAGDRITLQAVQFTGGNLATFPNIPLGTFLAISLRQAF